jgi:hypothetical protein
LTNCGLFKEELRSGDIKGECKCKWQYINSGRKGRAGEPIYQWVCRNKDLKL